MAGAGAAGSEGAAAGDGRLEDCDEWLVCERARLCLVDKKWGRQGGRRWRERARGGGGAWGGGGGGGDAA
jgi:hypothetical protein